MFMAFTNYYYLSILVNAHITNKAMMPFNTWRRSIFSIINSIRFLHCIFYGLPMNLFFVGINIVHFLYIAYILGGFYYIIDLNRKIKFFFIISFKLL